MDGDELGAARVPDVADSPGSGTPSSVSQGAVLLLAAVVGLVLGWAGARPLSGLAAGNILIWAVAVVALGAITGTAPGKALRLGASASCSASPSCASATPVTAPSRRGSSPSR